MLLGVRHLGEFPVGKETREEEQRIKLNHKICRCETARANL